MLEENDRIASARHQVMIEYDPSQHIIAPSVGQHWRVTGKHTVEKEERNGFKFDLHRYKDIEHMYCALPETGDQLKDFIAKSPEFKGIGIAKISQLWSKHGKRLMDLAMNDNEATDAILIEDLTAAALKGLREGFSQYKNLKDYQWMTEHDIPGSVQQRLLKHHEDSALKAIKADPYILTVFGMSFEKVDAVALSCAKVDYKPSSSLSPEALPLEDFHADERRLRAAIEVAIRKEVDKGHTYTVRDDIIPHLRVLLKDSELIKQALMTAQDVRQFVIDPTRGSYHPTAQLVMEATVSKRLLALSQLESQSNEEAEFALARAFADLPYPLMDKQKEAVRTSILNHVSCITGGAGTGKTTVLRTVLRTYSNMGATIHAVALSGRAAMRLHESIGFGTLTIAAFLRQEPVQPLPDDPLHVLVIDEASMIDLPTMYKLVTHIDPSVRIIFTGDPNQLPPIGCGKVLSDIVESKTIKNTTLDIVKRQSGATGIPEYSYLINLGEVPTNLTSGNITFHETSGDLIAQTCAELFIDSPSDSRVIAPTKVLVADINNLVQSRTNKGGDRMEFAGADGYNYYRNLRNGDQILFTQNNYEAGIQNGSLGKLIDVTASDGCYGVVELDTGERVEVNDSILDCMELGYAITLHKAQGSQFPRIIIALKKGRIVDRAWLYTAITRAETEIHIVGSERDFKHITMNPSHSHKRNSFLMQLLSNANDTVTL
ncbi:ATP-dependent RecD-like DNA helicase [Thalassotalea sp. PS06]|uniref:ATP-dependent RecD-like DNA helicase n=1 Tax=Thalassotalea sp. PS06 TaxID=2594005 RepID=UPI0021B0C4A5|nr:ATP-dependent RecD-like DNA helicase [Thalassotalea sp. PS06]